MSQDFRARQTQTTQVVSSGSSGTNAKIVFYDVTAQSSVTPNQGIIDNTKFGTGSIGTDIFLYVSGGIGKKDVGGSNAVSVFGGDVHVSGNLTLEGFGKVQNSLFRLTVADYASTTNTSSNPEVVGQAIFNGNEFSGSLTLRAIVNSAVSGSVAVIKLFELVSASFVDIAGPGQQELAVTGTTPTVVESVNLFNANGFIVDGIGKYELRLFTATSGVAAFVGGAELKPSGTFTNQTIITQSFTTTFISGTTGFRLGFNDFVTTTATASNPTIAGQVIFPADQFSGSLVLRTVLSVTDNTATGSIRLFNVTSGTYVELQPGQTILSTSNTTSTILSSQNLFGAVNFNTVAESIYELHVHSSTGSNIVVAGGAELRPSGSFTGVTTITNMFISGTWVDNNNRLRTTGSVSIDNNGNFADSFGDDVFFVVSPSLTNTALIDGRLYVSGNLIAGSNNSVIGNTSFIGGGTAQTIINDANDSAIIAGLGNNVLNDRSAIIAGMDNRLAGTDSVIIASAHSTASVGSQNSVIIGGQDNLVNSTGSIAIGTELFIAATTDRLIALGGPDYRIVHSGSRGHIFVGTGTNRATEFGEDVFFYVSGTFGSGSAGDSVAVFAGDVRISGTLAIGTGSAFISDDRITFTSASIRNVGGQLTFFDDNNLTGETLSDLVSGGENFWTVSGAYITTSSSLALKTPNSNLQYTGSFIIAPVSGGQNSASLGVRIYGGDGGFVNDASHTRKNGGPVEIYTGTGSNTANPIAAGHGGNFRLVVGKGGNSGTGLGGDGGNVIIIAGTGGNSTSTTAGVGGGFQFIAGDGGTGFGPAGGGGFELTTGRGIAGSGGSNVRGGNFTFRLGNGGNGTSETGRAGDFIVSGGGDFSSRASFETFRRVTFGSPNAAVPGIDVFFYVSGTFGSGSASSRIAAFGGDVKISGTLAVGTGSTYIKEDSIFINSASIRNVGGELKFFDNNNLTGETLSDLVAGRGDSFFFSNTANLVEQSGSIAVSGSGLFNSGLTGALNVLPDGSPYLLAGQNINLSTGANGQITISVTGSSVNGYSAEFLSNVWEASGINQVYTVSGTTHGLGTSNLQIQLFQSTSNGHILTTAQQTLINSAFDVQFTISSGSHFDGKVVLLKAGVVVGDDWNSVSGVLTTSQSVEIGGNVSIGGQTFPTQTGSLTLTGSSLLTNCNNSNVHFYTLTTGGLSLSTASNQQVGATYVWLFTQDGTGGHNLSFDTTYFTIIGNNSTIVTGANKSTVLSGISNGSKIFLTIAGDES